MTPEERDRLTRVEEQAVRLRDDIAKIERRLCRIEEGLAEISRTLNEARGGWKTLVAVGGLCSVVSGAAVKIISIWPVRF